MPEDDIYGNKGKYERFIGSVEDIAIPLEKRTDRIGSRKYYSKNKANISYFKQMHKLFETRDTSYVRRVRLLRTLKMITFVTEKDLKNCTREDINEIVAFSHNVNKSPKTKSDFIRDVKFLWKHLFPDKDEMGRNDETITPYVVRHLSPKIDKSREKRREDKLTLNEIESIVGFFDSNPQMQCYIMLALESLGRPQEMCYTRISDVEINESYAKVYVSSHGKEGTKFLQCIDSYPYLLKWYEQHPFKNDKNAFLFLAKNRKDCQLTPFNINKKLKLACRKLGIDKNITPYSLKRNGVTLARLRGDSDVDIQHRAGWTSTKQLQTYDMSNSDDSLKKQLAQRGLIQDEQYKEFMPKTKECVCGYLVGFTERICPKCRRLIDNKEIRRELSAEKQLKKVFLYALENSEMRFVDILDKINKRENITPLESIELELKQAFLKKASYSS